MKMKLCEYGCGREAKFPFKNGKWCCSKNFRSCPAQRKKNSIRMIKERKNPNSVYNSITYKKNQSKAIKEVWKDLNSGLNLALTKKKKSNSMKNIWNNPNSIYNSILWKDKISESMKGKNKGKIVGPHSEERKIKISKSLKLNIKKIKERYPFFSKIEEMRYNPVNPKEIQVHCKNHNCKNSKEKGGWFTPTYIQLYERIRNLEKDYGSDGTYLYCSQHCKDTCPLYGLHGDPYRDTGKPYTSAEKEVFNNLVLRRDNEICYYCKKHHATIVHHLRPQKLEPFFALDPDYAISVCKKCHYKYGHPTGSPHSTGNLAKIVCSVESQKFLNQK